MKTILGRVNKDTKSPADEATGGSTYTIDIWRGHPLEPEVSNTLRQIRATLSDLRKRVAEHNELEARPRRYSRVVIYAGQSLSVEGHE